MSDDLSRAMRATAENLTPNIGKLTSGGVERGVRKRRVRRISQIAGAAASVTAVFGVVAAVAPGSGAAPASAAAGTAPGVVAPTSTPANPANAGTATPTKAPTTSAGDSTVRHTVSAPTSAPSAPPVSDEEILDLLKAQVAPLNFRDVTVLNKAGSTTAGGPYAVLKVGYSAGVGNVSVNVEAQSWSNMGWGTTPPPYITIKNLQDGSHVVIYDGPEWPAGNGDPSAKRLDVTWYRTDGIAINVEGLNEATEKGATTATAVPFTADQAEKIATSPVWDAAAKAKAYQAWLDYQQAVANNGKNADPKAPGADAAKPAGGSGH